MFLRPSAGRGNDQLLRWWWNSRALLFELARWKGDWSEDEGPRRSSLRDLHLRSERFIRTSTKPWWDQVLVKLEEFKCDCGAAAVFLATHLPAVSPQPVLRLAKAIDLGFRSYEEPPDTRSIDAARHEAEMIYYTLREATSEQSIRSEVVQKIEDAIRRRAETLAPKLAKPARKENTAANPTAEAGSDLIKCTQADLARALGLEPNYTGLVERKLSRDGTLSYWVKRPKKTGYEVRFSDPVKHREVKEEVARLQAKAKEGRKRRKS
jgi:hypothetical protein